MSVRNCVHFAHGINTFSGLTEYNFNMGLFMKEGKASALIEVGADMVRVGYVYGIPNTAPVLVYTGTVPVVQHEGEEIIESAKRAIRAGYDLLIKEGAPALARYAKSARVEDVVAAVGSPWEDTVVRTVRIEQQAAFTFTREILKKAQQDKPEQKTEESGRIYSEPAVISTMLNGYETRDPFGKRVTRADVITATSSFDARVVAALKEAAHAAFHQHTMHITAAAPLWFSVFRDAYPHEHDFLIITAQKSTSDFVFVKQKHLVLCAAMPTGFIPDRTDGVAEKGNSTIWTREAEVALKTFSETHALPRTVFLMGEEHVSESLRGVLQNTALRSLWLSDAGVAYIPVRAEAFASFVSCLPDVSRDTHLLILAHYAMRVHSTKE